MSRQTSKQELARVRMQRAQTSSIVHDWQEAGEEAGGEVGGKARVGAGEERGGGRAREARAEAGVEAGVEAGGRTSPKVTELRSRSSIRLTM